MLPVGNFDLSIEAACSRPFVCHPAIVENPEAGFGDIARTISAKFKALPDKEKKKWEKKAADDKERYARDMAVYRGE
jgi:HMG (high mobility group) box